MWPDHDRWRAPVGDFPPRWASAWGDDRYGLWADLTMAGVTQRLRWIEPTGPDGFWMGTDKTAWRRLPKNYQDWCKNELPRHRVVLSRGFWLADTPCTQAFWQVVTAGPNPSQFVQAEDAAQRPVEQVSWDDIDERFVPGLATHHLPLDRVQITLPTEAEWEWACRAGSETAYAWGDEFDAARANANHGEGALKETSVVKHYAPNAWGLYDLHGNVWEWCADGKRDYGDTPQTDPRGPEGAEGVRVLRGGSWRNEPVFARSAFRTHGPRGNRHRHFGFRFALRSPSPGPEGTARGGAPLRPAGPA